MCNEGLKLSSVSAYSFGLVSSNSFHDEVSEFHVTTKLTVLEIHHIVMLDIDPGSRSGGSSSSHS
jgi:hypothetical protein